MARGERRHPGRALRMASDYGWRFLVLAGVAYVLLRILSPVLEVIIAVVVAMLATALLHPMLAFLRRRGIPRAMATVLTILLAVLLLGGILTYVVDRGVADFPALGHQINRLTPHVKDWLIHGPLHIQASSVNNLSSTINKELSKNSGKIASSALSTGETAISLITGGLLALFCTIFMLYDGDRVWRFLVGLFPSDSRQRVDRAGQAVWQTLSNYIRGTLIVAAFHGAVVAIALTIIGVPLVAPLALIVVMGAFIPLIGAIVAGALAVAVAGLTHGVVGAVAILVVLVVDNQVEAHVLQPFVVGRYVRIHPLATVLALAAGALLLGIFGAFIAVPAVATINAGVRALAGEPEPQVSPAEGGRGEGARSGRRGGGTAGAATGGNGHAAGEEVGAPAEESEP